MKVGIYMYLSFYLSKQKTMINKFIILLAVITIVNGQSCTDSVDCADDHYCNTTNICEQTVCSVSADCDGLFNAGRVRYCGDNNFCDDLYSGECDTNEHCSSVINKHISLANSVSKVTRTVSNTDNVVRISTTKLLMERIEIEKSLTYTSVTLAQTTETAVFQQSFIDDVGEATFIAALKDSMFNVQIVGAVTVQTAPSAGVGEVVVTITYELDNTAFTLITNDSTMDGTDFIANLASQLGIGAGNITVGNPVGAVVVNLVLVDVSDPSTIPVENDIIAEIEQLETELDIIVANLVSEISGLELSDIESSDIEYCYDRTCSGNGDSSVDNTDSVGCSDTTGICACNDGYWGVDCATTCNCENGRTCNGGLCECEYPEWGLRCENVKDCSACP
jgi:hypothetical protein